MAGAGRARAAGGRRGSGAGAAGRGSGSGLLGPSSRGAPRGLGLPRPLRRRRGPAGREQGRARACRPEAASAPPRAGSGRRPGWGPGGGGRGSGRGARAAARRGARFRFPRRRHRCGPFSGGASAEAESRPIPVARSGRKPRGTRGGPRTPKPRGPLSPDAPPLFRCRSPSAAAGGGEATCWASPRPSSWSASFFAKVLKNLQCQKQEHIARPPPFF